MDYKDSVVINVSYAFNFVEPRLGRVSQTRRAAQLIHGAVLFEQQLHNDTLQPDMGKDGPMCMNMYQLMFNTTRIPSAKTDHWATYHDDPEARRKVLVAHKNRFFIVDVYDQSNQLLSVPELEKQLEKVKSLGSTKEEWAVGVLTSDNRVQWAEARDLLLRDRQNRASLQQIEKTLFGVCLDEGAKSGLELERNFWHADGKNRFFDKSFQFIVMEDGLAGLNGEHSGVDGSPAWRMTNFVLDWEEEFQRNPEHAANKNRNSAALTPVEASFNITDDIKPYITNAEKRLAKAASEVDLQVKYFNKFGKDAIKSWKISPDAFCQMAMQLAVHSLTGEIYPTYESGQTRKFLCGRTETVRSVSAESVEFVKSMKRTDLKDSDKLELLRKACNRHTQTNQDACDGLGIDRHLLGLRLIAAEQGVEESGLYKDPAYSRISTWRLSTSQLTSPHFQVVFGPVAEDGIGCCYGILDNGLHFKASTALKCKTNATAFVNAVEDSLVQLAKICATGTTHHASKAKL